MSDATRVTTEPTTEPTTAPTPPAPITIDAAQALVHQAGGLLRSQPFGQPFGGIGLGVAEGLAWQQQVRDFLAQPLMQQALAQAGVTNQPGGPAPTEGSSAFLGCLDQALATATGDSPTVAGTVLVGLAGVLTTVEFQAWFGGPGLIVD